MAATKYEVADFLKAMLHNSGCDGVDRDLLFAIANLTELERGKLVALCARYGYTGQTSSRAALLGRSNLGRRGCVV